MWIIEGVTVERVNEYKYLGTVLDNKPTSECNTNNIVKKCHQIMFCLFILRSFGAHVLSCLVVWYFEFEE